MDGLHVRFVRQDVSSIVLGASPPSNPSFEGWNGAVFHFGRAVGAGTVSVTASTTLAATAGDAVSVDVDALTASSGRAFDVSAGETVSVQAATVSVEATASAEVSSDRVTMVSGAVDVFNGCLLYTSPSPRDATLSRMPSSA